MQKGDFRQGRRPYAARALQSHVTGAPYSIGVCAPGLGLRLQPGCCFQWWEGSHELQNRKFGDCMWRAETGTGFAMSWESDLPRPESGDSLPAPASARHRYRPRSAIFFCFNRQNRECGVNLRT